MLVQMPYGPCLWSIRIFSIAKQFIYILMAQKVEVGCAAVSQMHSISHKFSDHSSIFTAELISIVDALNIVHNCHHRNFVIFCDSKSVLPAINHYNYNHPIVLEIMNWLIRLAARQKTVRFCWVPSHINITGNQKADSEARRAASVQGEIYNRTLPHRDYYRLFRQRAMEHWSTMWSEILPNNKLRSIKDTTRLWQSSLQKNRRTEIILARLRIGHTRLTYGFLMERGHSSCCQDYLVIPLSCLFSLALIAGTSPQKSISARREQVPFSMAIGNGELMHDVFPNTRAWEQQDRN